MDIPNAAKEKFKGRPRLNSYPSPPDRFFIENLKKPKNVYLKCEGSSSNVNQLPTDNTKQKGFCTGTR